MKKMLIPLLCMALITLSGCANQDVSANNLEAAYSDKTQVPVIDMSDVSGTDNLGRQLSQLPPPVVPPPLPDIVVIVPEIYAATTAGDYILGFPAERFLLTDDDIKQELLEIIAASMQAPLTNDEAMMHTLHSIRLPFDFIVNDTRYSFEKTNGLLIIFDEEGSPAEFYWASDFERAMEIHRKSVVTLDYITFLELLKANGFAFEEPQFYSGAAAKVISISDERLIIYGHGIDYDNNIPPALEITWHSQHIWVTEDYSLQVVYSGNDETIISFLNDKLRNLVDE